MKPITFAVSLLVLGAISCDVFAQEDEVARLKSDANMFFENLANDQVKTESVFYDLFAKGPLEDRPEVDALITKFSKLETDYGKFLESEFISAKPIGRSLVLMKYLYKMEKFPVVWYFTYYRPPNANEQTDWVIISLRFDTRIDLLDLTERTPAAP